MTRKTSARFIALFAAALVFTLAATMFTGCKKNAGGEKAAGSKEPIKIGAILSVTGPAAFLGDPEKKTLEMLAEELNKNGGIDGRPVQMIIEDDGGEESKTMAATAKLIDKDQVVAIIGPSRSGNTIAIMQTMAAKKVPLVSCSLAEGIVSPVNEWVFKTPQRDSHVAEQVLGEANRQGITDAAVIYENTGFGQEGLKHIEALAGKFKVNITLKEALAPAATDSDVETILTRVKANSKIGAVIVWSVIPAQSAIPKKMKELGMDNVKMFASQGFGNIKYVQAAGAAAEGVIFPAGKLLVADQLADTDKQKKIVSDYKKAYETKFKEDSSVFGAHAYDAFYLIVGAIKAKGADRASIRDGIEQTQNFIGVDGIYSFSKADHNGLGLDSLELLTVKDGKFAFLHPPAK